MATFTRGGVTYPSQYAYRQAVAGRLGYDSVAEHRKASAAAQSDPTFRQLLQVVPRVDKAKMQAILWHNKGTFGEYVKGKPKQVPDDIGDLIEAMEERLDNKRYLIWRWLYA